MLYAESDDDDDDDDVGVRDAKFSSSEVNDCQIARADSTLRQLDTDCNRRGTVKNGRKFVGLPIPFYVPVPGTHNFEHASESI